MFSSLIALAIGHSLPLCAFAKTHASSSNRSDANVHESEVSAPHPNASIHDAWEKQRELAIHYSQSIETAPKAEAMFKDLVKRHECTDSLMDLASCYYKTNFDETYKLCSRADQLNNGKE